MGIEHFFSAIQNYNEATAINFINTDEKLKCEYLYLDFNSIIYPACIKVYGELNKLIKYIVDGKKNDDNELIKDIAKKYKLPLSETVAELKKEINKNRFNYVTNEVIYFILNMLDNKFMCDTIKYIYVSFDGVPTKSKMVEQQKRRYNSILISKIKNILYKKYENEIESREYERQKLDVDNFKASISPSTDYMDYISNRLKSDHFIDKLKEKCANLNTYICSDYHVPQEGEKKIYDDILNNSEINENIVFYSPDNDASILCLLLSINDKKNINVLKHDQQKNTFTQINIDKLFENINDYIESQLEINKDDDMGKKIICDTIFIFTIFGNDFVPKIESINISKDFMHVLQCYIDILRTGKFIINKKKKYEINKNMFIKLIEKLSIKENNNLKVNYIKQHYYNNKHIFNVVGENIKEIEIFFEKIKKLYLLLQKNLDAEHIIKELDNEQFIEQLKKLMSVRINTQEKIARDMSKIKNSQYGDEIDNFVKETENRQHDNRRFKDVIVSDNVCMMAFIDNYKKNKNILNIEYLFRKNNYQYNNHHHKILSDKLNREPNNYEIEVYKLENFMDQYKTKFNRFRSQLGMIYIDTDFNEVRYNKDENKEYYKYYFGINYDDENEREKIAGEYIDGLLWVFDWYYNKTNIEDNFNNANLWYYKYDKAPLLKDILIYLRKNGLKNSIFKKYNIKRELYYNCIEQYVYISPYSSLKEKGVIFLMYYKYIIAYFLSKNIDLDINNLANKILNNGSNDEINCSNSHFFSKCNIRNLKFINLINDKELIKFIRKNYKIKSDKQLVLKDPFIKKINSIAN